MDDEMNKTLIRTEAEFNNWFMQNHKKIGYEKIIRKDIGKFPDFIMLKNGKKVKVELETELSNFILHKHNIKYVDEIICIKNNLNKGVISKPVIEIKKLEYLPKLSRVSATINKSLDDKLDELLKDRRFRNKSHLIEEVIIKYLEENAKKR